MAGDVAVEAPGKSVAEETVAHYRLCSRCEYCLRGMPVSRNCPECGQPVRETLAPGAGLVRRPAVGLPLRSRARCVTCEAELGKLSTDDRCARCGAPAWLAACDLWARRVRLGMTLWIIYVLLSLTWLILSSAYPIVLTGILRVGADDFGRWMERLAVARQALFALLTILWVFVVVRLTEPEPGADEDKRWSLRRVLRGLAVLACFGVVVGVARVAIGPSEGFLVVGAVIIVPLVLDVQIVAAILYLRRFATRLSSRRLARRTTFAFWALAVCETLGWMSWWAIMVMASSFGRWSAAGPWGLSWLEMAQLSSGLVTLGKLFVSVWLAVLLFRYRAVMGAVVAELRVEAELARN